MIPMATTLVLFLMTGWGLAQIGPQQVCQTTKCCKTAYTEGGYCTKNSNWPAWQKQWFCLGSPLVCKPWSVPSTKCRCCKNCNDSWACTNKGGVCVDPQRVNWNAYNFHFCYLPSFVNCWKRTNNSFCLCCGWFCSLPLTPGKREADKPSAACVNPSDDNVILIEDIKKNYPNKE
eukprot:GFUD01034549.1.p1 GENE.GFUD01034549.1~~GFUD01034549.1.p1  ORF type:complete len:175 (+),score=12.30 GFUD01034549.1:1-525(+)